MTSKLRMFKLLLYAHQMKAGNSGNTVTATSKVFDLLAYDYVAPKK